MHATLDMRRVGKGFEHSGKSGQAVFRAALDAISRPGAVVIADQPAELPAGIGRAAGVVLLALLDHDCRFWVAPSEDEHAIAAYMRFHTGCAIVEEPAHADFAFVGHPSRLPELDAFAAGTDLYPDRSATVLLEVNAIEGRGWILAGPGIEQRARIAPAVPGGGFVEQWRAQRRRFPCGVDLFLACGETLAALPRTTSIEQG